MRNDHFQDFAESGGTLYGGSAASGIWSSRDEGRTWERRPTCFDGSFNSVTALHASEGVLAASFSGAGICLSTDGGNTWTEMNQGLAFQPFIETLIRVGDTLLAGGSSTAASPVILKASLVERKWTRSDSGLPAGIRTVERLLFARDGTVVAGISNTRIGSAGTVFVSRDHGKSWSPTPIVFPNLVYDMAFAADVLILATERGIFRTEDLGGQWRAPSGEPPRDEFYSLMSSGKKLYAGSGHAGIYQSDDYGLSWNSIQGNLPDSGVSIDALWASSKVVLASLGPGRGAWILAPGGTSVRLSALPGRKPWMGSGTDILGRAVPVRADRRWAGGFVPLSR